MPNAVINELRINAGALNTGSVPAGAGTPPDTTSVRGRPWTMEVRDQDGVWLANVLQWRGGKRTAKANAFDTVTLSVPADDTAAPYLIFPNEVWLYLGDYDTVVQKFTVVTREERRAAGNWVTVECESLLGQLGREVVDAYSTPVTDDGGDLTYETQTLKNIVGELLATMQTQSPVIRLGKIDAAIGDVSLAISFQNKSILQCLRELHRFSGGYFYVDTDRRLQWRTASGYDAGHWIRFGHNLTQIEVRTDYRTIQTQLLAYGPGGETDTRLVSTADDSAAQSSYGVIRGVVYQDAVNEQSSLDTVAAAELARRATPMKSYKVGIVNLAAVDPSAYSFEAGMLYVGTRVGVYVDSPEVELETTVMGINWDLDHPLRVEIELSDPNALPESAESSDGTHGSAERTLFDYIADALEEAGDRSSDAAVLAVGRSLSPPTDNIQDVLTIDNVADRMADRLELPYGTDDPDNTDYDRFEEAMLQRLINALGNSAHPKYDALNSAIRGDEANKWVQYTGS